MGIVIREDDVVKSVADALQFISYYHPADYIRSLAAAYEKEESPAAKDAMAQILLNSRMAALGRRPICQDTGMVSAFMKVGMNVRFETNRSIADLINEGVKHAYTDSIMVIFSRVAMPLTRDWLQCFETESHFRSASQIGSFIM